MRDIVIDTQTFVDFLCQYYKNHIYSDGFFQNGGFISGNLATALNRIVLRYRTEEDFSEGIVSTSILSFIEVARKFDDIASEKFNILQFRAFLENRPAWIFIIPLSDEVYNCLYRVPKTVICNGVLKTIEWADAVHCASYLTRDNGLFATSDQSIRSVRKFNFIG